jgi:hypothetical protein
LAAGPQVAGKLSPADRVESLYQIVFARRPDEAETELGLRFVGAAQADAAASDSKNPKRTGGLTPAARPLDPWAQYAQVLLASNEFLFVD